MSYCWPGDTVFHHLTLDVEDRSCVSCDGFLKVYSHRQRRFFTFEGPIHLTSKLARCSAPGCPGHGATVNPEGETALVMPRWILAWDVFCWLGHRRFARHWSVPQIREELADAHQIRVSADAIERYIGRYQRMLAARQQDPCVLAEAYRGTKALTLSIDGLQPEKGHETLYVVRELSQKRVWFAEALLSSSAAEVRRLFVQAREWAKRLHLPIRLWLSDKQDAFVTGIAAEFPGVPHRYCSNHFVRDLAKPMLNADSHTKVEMRGKIRGLRAIERTELEAQHATQTAEVPEPPAAERAAAADSGADSASVVLDYCAAVRGILNDDQGGPLHPPGLRMAEALGEVRESLQRNLEAKKGGAATSNWSVSRRVSTEA